MTTPYFTAGPPSSPPDVDLCALPYPVTCWRCGRTHAAGTTVALESLGWACVEDCQ